MSEAFRRESDAVYREPKFAVPVPSGRNLMTEYGKALVDGRGMALGHAVFEATDDAAIATGMRDQRYWQPRQVTAKQPQLPTGERVEFGTTVTFALGSEMRTVKLVGSNEATAEPGYLSLTTPLARALMGGESCERLPFAGRVEAIEVAAVTVEPQS